MTTADVLKGVGIFLGGGGLTALLQHLRKGRKDASEINMAWHTQIMVEQKDWRDMLLRQIDAQSREIEALRKEQAVLQTENAGLRKKVAELAALNDDLKRDNEELEARVKELERELRKHDATAVARL